ncbi:MAG: hypothetical protein CVU40_04820 [Chloroflexi bacterium HGW-Chloroflexi-2]|jgi:membrane-bound metal-dependent hydrolase YbcI (DUF457 family)|nr:MAG: hypothetical protein CVU40_04820 [Chloroflexi bacterium HGW-Chloroflexi-2]
MNTPSHIIINLAIKRIKGLRKARIPWQAVFWGSMMPDIPLGVLSLGVTFYYRVILGNQSPDLMEAVLHPLYFNNPFWISAHNLLHAPFILGLSLAILWRWRIRPGQIQHWLFWFFSSSAVHAGIDIFTHYDDGPLVFWPFNWNIRFNSPISYWDPAHFGTEFMIFELLLDAVLVGFLLLPKITRYLNHRKDSA